MTLFQVDPEKCRRDGFCLAVCPGGLLEMKDQDSPPTPIEGAEELCIDCGHCVAVCPHGALSQRSMTPEDCPPIKKELNISAEQAEQFLRARRSIRVYRDERVPRSELEELLHLASHAPSGRNARPLSWLVIETPAEVLRLAGLVVDWMKSMTEIQPDLARERHFDRFIERWEKGQDRICRGAPHVLVVHAPESDVLAPTAADIALSYLELFAFSRGLGACWGGYFNIAANFHPPMTEALDLPDGHRAMGAMMIGYPDCRYFRLPRRNPPTTTWV